MWPRPTRPTRRAVSGAAIRQDLARDAEAVDRRDRKSTRLNSSHLGNSYAVFCLKKKKHHGDASVQSGCQDPAARRRKQRNKVPADGLWEEEQDDDELAGRVSDRAKCYPRKEHDD